MVCTAENMNNAQELVHGQDNRPQIRLSSFYSSESLAQSLVIIIFMTIYY